MRLALGYVDCYKTDFSCRVKNKQSNSPRQSSLFGSRMLNNHSRCEMKPINLPEEQEDVGG